MFQTIQYKPAFRSFNRFNDTPAEIVLNDSCLGMILLDGRRVNPFNQHAALIEAVVRTYHKKNLNVISNLNKCLRYMYRYMYNIDLYRVINLASDFIRVYYTDIKFDKYLPLFEKVYIPRILKEP